MSDEAGSTPLVQSKLARARAGRGSMLGPTPAAKKLAKPVPFGGVQTLPRRSPDASRSLIQATSRLSRNLTSPTSSQVQLSPNTQKQNRGPQKDHGGRETCGHACDGQDLRYI